MVGSPVDIRDDQLSSRFIAVGVDGSAESMAAARYGVQAASDRGADLLLVHAYEMPSINAPVELQVMDEFREQSRQLVADVAAQLVVPSNMRIESLSREDLPAPLLLRVAQQVSFLAVGQDHLTWGERLMFGRVASQVAERSDCPMAVVPGGWRAAKSGSHHPVVVVLEDTLPARATLQLAFEQAVLLSTGLVALHASPYGSSTTEVARQQASQTELLAGWKEDYPDVTVESLVVLGDEDANLLRWSKKAAILVVERRHRHWWHPWTHSVASAVLKQTHCPLIIVPQQSRSGAASPD
jgi:nucleotide-binding universal stress UspA family protein